jgi:type IV pilus assembly protein PilB
VQDQLLDREQALNAIDEAERSRVPLVHYLVNARLLDSRAIAMSAANQFGIPFFDLAAMNITQVPKGLVGEALIRKHHIAPLFRRANHLYIAIADPIMLQALDEVKFQTGLNTEPVLVEENKLSDFISQMLNQPIGSELSNLQDEDLDALNLDTRPVKKEETNGALADTDDAPIVRFVNKVLLDAVKRGASDIHFEPYEGIYRIRLRTDGILHEVARPPVGIANRLTARIKIISNMDISERRVPQDGRIKLDICPNRTVDFRVNTLPTLWGEKIVLRLLDPSSVIMDIDALGYEEDQKAWFLQAIHQPQGMVLVTGPTGSGKTVSLYTALNILNTEARNISTIEDPVEINLEGINQVNINSKVGLNFASALRAFLRQDPDILMVGEIRDLETAEIAIKAAQTGHLVLSTLHTNSAPETLSRLSNMGVEPFNIASAVSLIIAQRLARRLCEHCKKAERLPASALGAWLPANTKPEELTVYRPQGCDQCHQGYKGRVGIYEVVPMSEHISKLIMQGSHALDIAEQTQRENFNNLRQSGLLKVMQGITSLEELNRITNTA